MEIVIITSSSKTETVIKIRPRPNTPEIVLRLIHYLHATYPLHLTKYLYWEFYNRDMAAHHAVGFAGSGEYKGFVYTTLKIALGYRTSRIPVANLLHTVAHEFMHAIQYDREVKEKRTTSKARDEEADRFADEVINQFLQSMSTDAAVPPPGTAPLSAPSSSSHQPSEYSR